VIAVQTRVEHQRNARPLEQGEFQGNTLSKNGFAKAPNRNEIITWKEKTNGKERGKKPIGDTQGRPNILVIFGDDIGITNLSCYSDGLMGYETPNIDRIAKEASAFDTTTASNRAPPGAPIGMSQLDPSIGGLLKNVGYATGQFGKNHVGDRNETLPTVNGFNEFFGNLYHLNAEEEPELPDYPKDPAYRAKFGPRGVLKCKATRQGRAHHRSAVREDRQADH
jgi:arylsulfatase A-like enzyme